MAALGFALTVAMMGVTGGILMQSGNRLDEGGPILSADVDPIGASDGPNGQWLRISHESGDAVDVANLTINVSIPAHRKRAQLHGLPTDGIRQSDYDGNHLFTRGPAGVRGAAVGSEADRTWTSGEVIAVRIEPRRVDLRPGQRVRVTVRHAVADRRLYRETVDVVGS